MNSPTAPPTSEQPPAAPNVLPTPEGPHAAQPEVPGPPPSRLLGWRGNALRFFRNPVGFMVDLREKYGDVVKMVVPDGNPALLFRSRVPKPATYFAFGPECNRTITTDLETFESRAPRGPQKRVFERLSTNFFFINGDRHKQQRRLMMPVFTRESLRRYYDDMVAYADRMLSTWKPGQTIELEDEMSNLAMNIGSKTLYGLDPGKRDQDLAVMMVRMVNALFSPVTMLPVNLPGMPYWKLIRNMERITAKLREEIEKKRARGSEDPDVLSMMVRAHDEDPTQLTEDELIGQAFVMFFAGHDTSAKALTWTLFLLAQHPAAMAELVEEFDENLGGAPPTYEQIFSLPVLDRVSKESLRILTPAVMFARVAKKPTTLGGYEIPEGSEIVYSPYITHIDPEIYAEPKKFLPGRWLALKPSPYEYLPFGVGQRTCLGVNFGGLQLRLLVSMIVQKYRLQVVPGTTIDLKTNVVIGPKHDIPMIVHEQDREFHRNKSEVGGYIREMVDFS